jgi:GxxExxY protein
MATKQDYAGDEYPLQELTDAIIAAAVDVHRALGPGFLEKIYENALTMELESRGHRVERQTGFDIEYRGKLIGKHQADMIVDGEVVVELKSVERLAATHSAQLRSTLKAAGRRVGLLMNFNQSTLVAGLRRIIN